MREGIDADSLADARDAVDRLAANQSLSDDESGDEPTEAASPTRLDALTDGSHRRRPAPASEAP